MKIPEGSTTDDVSEAQRKQRIRTALPSDASENKDKSQKEQNGADTRSSGQGNKTTNLERQDSDLISLSTWEREGKLRKRLNYFSTSNPTEGPANVKTFNILRK